MKRVYITGAAGLLGANLAYRIRNDYAVFGSDRNPLLLPGLSLTRMDYRQPDVLERDIRAVCPDCVIHCAAYSDVDGCERNPELARQMNVTLAERTAFACRSVGARMIYISTDAIYCGEQGTLSREDSPVSPCNVYAATKLAGERHTPEDGLILRTNFVGYNARTRISFFEWMTSAMHRGETLRLFGDVSFSPLSVDGFVRILALCLERPLCGVYNASCDGSVTKLWFGQTTQRIFGLSNATIEEISVRQAPFLARRSNNMGLDNRRLQQALGGSSFGSAEDTILQLKALWDAGYPQMLRRFSP